MRLTETAFAKINLALHVRARRDDGYHQLETVFAFVDAGDRLVAHSCEADRLEVTGEFAGSLTDPFDNIVARALTALPHGDGLCVSLEKNLPVAAGLGGGSADAGAIFRMVKDSHGLPDDWQDRAARLGADVPACVDSVTCVGRGTGTELEPIESDLTGCAVLLVNPRIPLSTGPVFAAWDGRDLGPLPTGAVSQIAQEGRNDLQAPAIALVPLIAAVLDAIAANGAFLSRMSGSGATCFGLFRDDEALARAAQAIARDHPGWWQMQGHLR
ncbi:4-(cytidine 5'-diphospho)-2-C-methyl-D-erythritol kinase [Alteraurantiacibacter aestuarii]|uniref:4-(cytidine 5'-diphospho)-2-C-methyl-D-erythritol kinase n=1 Tax=Alteraurantiacibacter aestuarii TaxID=650004 RepID=UPI0031DDBF34